MASWGTHRTVVEEAAVSTYRDTLREQHPRIEEAWDALSWLLARSADKMGLAPQSGDKNWRLYVQSGDPLANLPSLWIIFRLDPGEVVVFAMKAVSDEPEE